MGGFGKIRLGEGSARTGTGKFHDFESRPSAERNGRALRFGGPTTAVKSRCGTETPCISWTKLIPSTPVARLLGPEQAVE
jgi:hypothetical protein